MEQLKVKSKKIERVGIMAKNGITVDNIAAALNIKSESVIRYLRAYRALTGELVPQSTKANILLLDIETIPVEAYVWRCWKENVSQKQIKSPSMMLSWSAKWLYDPGMMYDIITPEEIAKRDNSRIIKSLWSAMENCDIVVAHNGQAFDIKRINTEFLLHGLGQPSPYKTVDTCLAARKYFGFEHNSLDYLAQRLGLLRKIDTDFDLWIACMGGDKQALEDMLTYNQNDVLILEEVYLKLRPWIKDHPNLGLFTGDDSSPVCRNCGSTNLSVIGWYYTPVNKFESLRCECGAIGRRRKSETSFIKNQHVLQAIS